ncbi:MAG: alpha/beta hydrolase [Gammaproteobacteria bacterium]
MKPYGRWWAAATGIALCGCVAGRSVPVPGTASEAMQAEIARSRMLPPLLHRLAIPGTPAQWQAIAADNDAEWSVKARVLAQRLGVSVQPYSVAGVTVRRVLPADADCRLRDRLVVHVHGGSYVFFGGEAGLIEAILIADRVGVPVLSIDYRMPPQHPFPAAVDDVVTVYRELLNDYPRTSLALGGTSAGGGLALAATHAIIRLGLPSPGALFAGTPWADLTEAGDSRRVNEGIDRVLVTASGMLRASAQLYAGGHELTDPLVSPVYGSFEQFPPTQLVSGTRDLLLSDTVRVHRKMRAAGVPADLNVYEGVSHGDYLLVPDSPESREVHRDLSEFLRIHLNSVSDGAACSTTRIP